MNEHFLSRLFAIINQAMEACEDDPDSEISEELFGPLNEIGFHVEQAMALLRAKDDRNPTPQLPDGNGQACLKGE